MSYKNLLLVAVCLCAGTFTSARAEHYTIFLLAGQSNLDGRGAVKDLTGDLGIKELPFVIGQVYDNGKRGNVIAADARHRQGQALNGDGVHYHIREGKHNLTLVDWKCYLDFADRIFVRRKPR